MNTEDYKRMTDEQLKEYISALADRDAAGLSTEQIDVLEHVVRERPGMLGEYQLDVATKLCLLRRAKHVRCPESTAESIRSILYHVYKSRQASL
jgi:hypothetical protein